MPVYWLNKGQIKKKSPIMPCALSCSLKQKKTINTLNEPGRRNLGCAFAQVKTGKKQKTFFAFFKIQLVFRNVGAENV